MNLSLKERLEELFNEIESDLILHLFPDKSNLIIWAGDTRNYYTHFSKELESKALVKRELFILTERFKLLLLILLLKETEIDQAKAFQIIKDSPHFLFNHIIVE